jgi:DNA-binding GntR family transcriptional regulator
MVVMHYISINHFSTEPLYRQIKQSIKNAILNSILKHNDTLPSEHKIMEVFEVSSTVIKKAYQALEAEQLIIRIRGKGTFINYPPKISINLPFNMRTNPNLTIKIRNLSSTGIDSSSPVAMMFQSTKKIAKIKRIIFMNDQLTTYQEIFFPYKDRKQISEYMTLSKHFKDIIFEELANPEKSYLINKHGIKKATHIEAKFLNIEEGFPLHRITSYIYDPNNQVRFIIFTFIRGDVVSFRLDRKL